MALDVLFAFVRDALSRSRYGLTDVEQLAADGFMDAYIDQSWSGAWQDVPTRGDDGLGWTHQLGYVVRASCLFAQSRVDTQDVHAHRD